MFKIGEAWKIHFSLRDLGGQLPTSSPGLVIGDCSVRKDDGNFVTAQGSLDEDVAVFGHYSYTFHSSEYSPTFAATFLMQLSGYRDFEITIYPEPKMVDDLNDPTAVACQADLTTVLSNQTTINDNVLAAIAAIAAQNDISADDVITALKASTGYTQGGTMTFATALNILLANVVGIGQDKAGETNVVERLDPDDGTTPIYDETLSKTTPYRQTTVQI